MAASHSLTAEQIEHLTQIAVEARENAYPPFSGFKVGAALLATEQRIFPGVNVENSSYGLTICAERTAACSAVAAGVKKGEVIAVAVAAEGGATPCGACRQFLYEFGDDIAIFVVDTEGNAPLRELSIASLLPEAFRFEGPGK
ncbi:MAG: cytidine deaminase [Planctomycetota bacterium]